MQKEIEILLNFIVLCGDTHEQNTNEIPKTL